MAYVNHSLFNERHLVTYDGVPLPADQIAAFDEDIQHAFALGYETAKEGVAAKEQQQQQYTDRPAPGLYYVQNFGLILQRDEDAWFTAIGGGWVPLPHEWWDPEYLTGRRVRKYDIGVGDTLFHHFETTIEGTR